MHSFVVSRLLHRSGHLENLRPANLPSSLSICLSIILVYSTHPPVSVLVRIQYSLTTTIFLGTWV